MSKLVLHKKQGEVLKSDATEILFGGAAERSQRDLYSGKRGVERKTSRREEMNWKDWGRLYWEADKMLCIIIVWQIVLTVIVTVMDWLVGVLSACILYWMVLYLRERVKNILLFHLRKQAEEEIEKLRSRKEK